MPLFCLWVRKAAGFSFPLQSLIVSYEQQSLLENGLFRRLFKVGPSSCVRGYLSKFALILPLRARELPWSVFQFSVRYFRKTSGSQTLPFFMKGSRSSAMSAVVVLVRIAGLSGFS